MDRKRFGVLFDTLKERVSQEGKKSPEWFLGFVEGLGTRRLTGYQTGALVDLLLVPEKKEPAAESGVSE